MLLGTGRGGGKSECRQERYKDEGDVTVCRDINKRKGRLVIRGRRNESMTYS